MTFCGLDFGTSNSTLGVSHQQRITMVPLEGQSTTLRSAIFLNEESKRLEFGKRALQHYIEGVEGRLLMSLKSVLGSSLMQERTLVFDKLEAYTDLLGHFIKHLKQQAETFQQADIDSVVIGRPVYFKDNAPDIDQLAQHTLECILKRVGFKQIKFQFEPIAASAFYRQQIQTEQLVLIVDLGGGTSDFSLIRMHPHLQASSTDIIATEGIHIGGNDFDKALNYEQISPHLGRGSCMTALNGSSIEIPHYWYHDLATWHKISFLYNKQTLIDLQKLLQAAQDKPKLQRLATIMQQRLGHLIADQVEASKIAFSEQPQTMLDLEFVEQDLRIPLTRSQFFELLQDDIAQLERIIQQLAATAQISLSAINSVFFTGGSSKISLIRERIMQLCPQASLIEGDYFNSVGMGLVIEAQALFG